MYNCIYYGILLVYWLKRSCLMSEAKLKSIALTALLSNAWSDRIKTLV